MLKHTSCLKLIALLAGALFISASGRAQTTWYVDDAFNPDGDGSPENPFDRIQEAIWMCEDGDTVLVADGIYTGWLNKNLTFDGLAITVRSANGPEDCIIDCNGYGRAFLFDCDEGVDSVVDGFTLVYGRVEYPQFECGGAIACLAVASPTIMNCLLTENVALGSGGAIWIAGDPTIIGCTITGNYADNSGGGIHCSGSDVRGPHLIDCLICDNIAGSSDGGGIYWSGGGGGADPLIANCLIRNNEAYRSGGGIGCRSELTIVNCCLTGNLALCTGTDEMRGGGGLYCSSSADVDVINCTIADNRANGYQARGGGFYCYESDDLVITNTNLWNNYPNEGALNREAHATIHYTNRGCTGLSSEHDSGYIWGPGNISADPLFADPNNGDYALISGSPCIDAASNWLIPPDRADLDGDGNVDEITPLDLDGEGRFFDDPNTVDTGCGFAVVDMGAYEFGGTGPQACFGDLDGDCNVDLTDLAQLLGNYGMTTGATYPDGSLDCDDDVDLDDLAALLAVYGTNCQ